MLYELIAIVCCFLENCDLSPYYCLNLLTRALLIGPPGQPQRGARVRLNQSHRGLHQSVISNTNVLTAELPVTPVPRSSAPVVLSAASPTGEPSACPGSPQNIRPDTLRVTTSSCASIASGTVQSNVRRTLGLDPRMINFSVVKLGDKLEEIKDVEGKVGWNNIRQISDTI